MSQVTIYTCDRCGKKHEGYPSGWMWLSELYGGFSKNLCYECKEKFLCFLRKKPYKD